MYIFISFMKIYRFETSSNTLIYNTCRFILNDYLINITLITNLGLNNFYF